MYMRLFKSRCEYDKENYHYNIMYVEYKKNNFLVQKERRFLALLTILKRKSN